jgi:hypothetical protein
MDHISTTLGKTRVSAVLHHLEFQRAPDAKGSKAQATSSARDTLEVARLRMNASAWSIENTAHKDPCNKPKLAARPLRSPSSAAAEKPRLKYASTRILTTTDDRYTTLPRAPVDIIPLDVAIQVLKYQQPHQ